MINDFHGKNFFLDNFFPSPMKIDGKIYATNEHFFQANKATTEEGHEKIRKAKSPGDAKMKGQVVDLVKDWEEIKLGVMKRGLEVKFSNKKLRKKLLKTGNQELIEGNTWHDTTWGVCNGVGKNWLGKLLMALREDLRKTND